MWSSQSPKEKHPFVISVFNGNLSTIEAEAESHMDGLLKHFTLDIANSGKIGLPRKLWNFYKKKLNS